MPITKTYYKVHRCFPDPDYFYMENISGNTATFGVFKSGTPASTDLAYSFDKVTWTDIHNGGTISNVANGAKVYLRSSTGFSSDEHNYYTLKGTDNQYSKGVAFNVGGHIATLINYTNVGSVTSLPNYSLNRMFGNGTDGNGLVHANIDFYGIKTLGERSCERMFYYCVDLVSIPDFSDIEDITRYSLNNTCFNCTSLMTPFDLSNVTSWTVYSLAGLYGNCSSLTEAIAPNVTTTWEPYNAINWLSGVAATGVVRKPAGLTIPTDNDSGVPTGWTTEDY